VTTVLAVLLAAASLGAQSAAPRGTQAAPSTQGQGAGRGNAPDRGAPRGPELWWRDKSPISRELGLTKEQADKIEKLFQETRPTLNKLDNDLQRRESTLSNLIKDDSPELIVSQYIDKVESTRTDLNKVRQLMLYHMRQVLTEPQRAKFEVLHAQFQQELLEADLERQKQELARQAAPGHPGPKPDDRPATGRLGGRAGK
jgi:Spy/CpxP family protein refolding chaperone